MNEWIPITTRKMTEEEIKELAKVTSLFSFDEIDPKDFFEYTCDLPEDEQEVLITTFMGTVTVTTFNYNFEYGASFDGYEEEGDVLAWMPLPEAYKEDKNGIRNIDL